LLCFAFLILSLVQRAYRGLLKLQLNWTVNKVVWYEQIPAIRALFEQHAYGVNGEKFLSQVEADLKQYKHPDPYCFPYYEKGTKFERNLPPHAFVVDDHAFLEEHR
jgi:NADH dehydrogenase (ubiquinone) 1 beta subcomplex subunit 9